MRFNTALKYVLEHEGGLVDHPRDPGGITKYGISLRAYPDLKEEGIRNLTIEQAAAIYKKDYWDAMKCDLLHDEIRLMVFDCAVNQGVAYCTKALQGAVGAVVDGKIGPKTISASHRAKPLDIIHKMATARMIRYSVHPEWNTFRSGWINRLMHITIYTGAGNGAESR